MMSISTEKCYRHCQLDENDQFDVGVFNSHYCIVSNQITSKHSAYYNIKTIFQVGYMYQLI